MTFARIRNSIHLGLTAYFIFFAAVAFADEPKAKTEPKKVEKGAPASSPGVSKSTENVVVHDGTKLSTDIFRAEDATGPQPVVFARGPYGKAGVAVIAPLVCKRGYTLVVQDMRGRGASDGNDGPVFHNDGWSGNRDGQESIEWIEKQPWCNGSVATWGGSALGITQNLEAPGAPKALKAQFVQVAYSDMYSQCAYQGGAWRTELIEEWLRQTKFKPVSLESFLKHPKYDDFWAGTNPEAQAARVDAPAIFWGGWYDIFCQGTINSFVTIHNHGGENARGKCRLIMGPYAHGTFNQLKYPPNSMRQPLAADAFRYFDYLLKAEKNGAADDKPVHYYVMGDPTDPAAPGNVWREADNWPPPSKETKYYLQVDRRLSTNAPTSGNDFHSYKYDPRNPVPTHGGQNLTIPKGPEDQKEVESRPDVLVYTSDVLTEPVEVTGRILAKLAISSDCPDTDFTVKLCDVYPDGRSMLVTDGILRTRFRNGVDREVFLTAGKVEEVTVDLWSTSLVFNKGHRIRVAVSSSNSTRFDPNPNTGKPFRADKETRVATNAVYFTKDHPSHIILPIYDEKAAK